MKVFTLALVAVLLMATVQAIKIERTEKSSTSEDSKSTENGAVTKKKIIEAAADKYQKGIHKRGIFHHGGTLGSTAGLWPKTYASHYGYGLHLPAAASFSTAPLLGSHSHSPSFLKYNSGFHYKTFAAPSVLPGVSGLSATLPTYGTLSPAVSHVHSVPAAHPFIIRPGGAVVQSYSATYPHRKTLVKPVQAFASLTPAHLHPLQASGAIPPAVTAVRPVHSFQTGQHIQPTHHVQHLAAVPAAQPVAAVQPAHHFSPVQPVHHLHPVPPVQPILQVQYIKTPVHYDVTQQFPPFFQTSFIPSAPVPNIPQAPTVSFSAAQPAFPGFPSIANVPTIPTIPSVPTIPSIPDVPAVPSIPNIPTIPSIPNFPQPQVPANGFFPVNVQPPFNQKPPDFGNLNPQSHFPDFRPVSGHNPDVGSADASPQIPVQPLPSPEPELPNLQPQPTEQPWKPVSFEPPADASSVSRPSHTLLPPYGGNYPAEGYLPPSPSSSGGRYQQEYTIDSSLFDNLSDSEIQQIFTQASLAAQNDHLQHHHHHTVHNYHSPY